MDNNSLPYVTLELLSPAFVTVSLISLVNLKKSDLTLKEDILSTTFGMLCSQCSLSLWLKFLQGWVKLPLEVPLPKGVCIEWDLNSCLSIFL